MGGSIHTLKENAEALVAATREIGLEVSVDKHVIYTRALQFFNIVWQPDDG